MFDRAYAGSYGSSSSRVTVRVRRDEDARLARLVDRQIAPQSAPVSLSFGVVQMTADETLSEALHRADQALYEAKRQGRSRAVVATESTTSVTSTRTWKVSGVRLTRPASMRARSSTSLTSARRCCPAP